MSNEQETNQELKADAKSKAAQSVSVEKHGDIDKDGWEKQSEEYFYEGKSYKNFIKTLGVENPEPITTFLQEYLPKEEGYRIFWEVYSSTSENGAKINVMLPLSIAKKDTEQITDFYLQQMRCVVHSFRITNIERPEDSKEQILNSITKLKSFYNKR